MSYFMDDWTTQAVAKARRDDLRREAAKIRLAQELRHQRPQRRTVREFTGHAMIRAGAWIGGIDPDQVHPSARWHAAG